MRAQVIYVGRLHCRSIASTFSNSEHLLLKPDTKLRASKLHNNSMAAKDGLKGVSFLVLFKKGWNELVHKGNIFNLLVYWIKWRTNCTINKERIVIKEHAIWDAKNVWKRGLKLEIYTTFTLAFNASCIIDKAALVAKAVIFASRL